MNFDQSILKSWKARSIPTPYSDIYGYLFAPAETAANYLQRISGEFPSSRRQGTGEPPLRDVTLQLDESHQVPLAL